MGKKRKMRAYPQKFARKFASHPYTKALQHLSQVKEEAIADGVITDAEKLRIAKAEAEVESLTPVLDAVQEALASEAVEEPAPPELAVEAPVVKEKPKARTTRKTTTKRVPTKRKYTRKKTEDKE